MKKKKTICEFCEREVEAITCHHLIPRALHSKKWYKKNYKKEDLNKTIELCQDCHLSVHQFIKEKDLGKRYNTAELLKNHPKVSKFIFWVATQNKKNIKTNRPSRRQK